MSESEKIIKKTLKYCPDTTYAYPLTIKTGRGCYIEDYEGKKYLDFNAQVCSCPVGYGHPEIMEVIRKYASIGAHKIGGQDFFTAEQADLAEKLSTILPRSLSKIFFINTGAEAVENALKISYRKRSLTLKVSPNDLYGVSCYGAFHGRTLGALTFNYSKQIHKKGYPEFKVKRINFCTEDGDPNINEIRDVISKDPDEIAFMLMEPVQGEGGYKIASKKFIRTVRDETEKHRIPLIMDEVQSGMGRTGKWWAFEHYGIEPDILTTAKALQVGATIFREEYDPKERGAISSTWGGGSRIDMAVGLKTIEIIEKENLLKNAEKMGKYFLKRIDEWKEQYPQIIIGSSGLGLMVKADFNTKENRDFVEDNSYKEGLMLLGCGEKSMRIAPPLTVTEKEADEGMDIFESQLKKLAAGH